MFYYVAGTVAYMEQNLAVIDCGGVGYACFTTNNTLSRLQQGGQAKLYTYLNVRKTPWIFSGFTPKTSSTASSC